MFGMAYIYIYVNVLPMEGTQIFRSNRFGQISSWIYN